MANTNNDLIAQLQSIPDNRTAGILRTVFETVPFFLGVQTAEQIEKLNTDIAAGRLVVGAKNASLVRKDDGALLTLQGIGTEARFTASGTSEGVAVQTPRNSNYTLRSGDSGSILPFTQDAVVTIDTDSDLRAPVEIKLYDGSTVSVVAAGGVVLRNPLLTNSPAWGTLQVTNKLSSILICLGEAADEYAAYKIGT